MPRSVHRATAVPAALLAMTALACARGVEDDPTIVSPSTTSPSPSQSPPPTTSVSSAPASPSFDGTLVTIEVSGGRVRTADEQVRVRRGERVRIVVTADVSDEMHVHGYDLSVDVTPGQPAQVEFVARVQGIFEVELEQARKLLVELRVQ